MRKNIFQLLFSLGIPSLLRLSKSNYLTVLSLHRISTERDPFFDPIDPKLFDQLLEYIKKYYNVISFRDLSNLSNLSKKPYLILSFDDGYFDFYEYALPILLKHNLPSNHNIVNECVNNNDIIWTQRLNFLFNHLLVNNLDFQIEFNNEKFQLSDFNNNWVQFNQFVFQECLKLKKDERNILINQIENKLSIKAEVRMMNWDEINECSKNNIEIGSHTFSHDVISTISDNEILLKEISNSKIEIESKINKLINVIALPNGQGKANIHTLIEKVGFEYLLYVNNNLNSLKMFQNKGLKIIDRINLVNESYSETILRTEMFHQKIRG